MNTLVITFLFITSSLIIFVNSSLVVIKSTIVNNDERSSDVTPIDTSAFKDVKGLRNEGDRNQGTGNILDIDISKLKPSSRVIRSVSNRLLCGRNLVEALSLVCHSIYASPGFKRGADTGLNDVSSGGSFSRSMKRQRYQHTGTPMEESEARGEEGTEVEGYLYLDPENEEELFLRGIRGVHDECCKKSCSFAQLQSYCGGAVMRRRGRGSEGPGPNMADVQGSEGSGRERRRESS